ncbi:hypothetical protein [Streptomyces sp. MH60]|uniref:hypothetical protein n=1 Tax=Streptomyces sp. MH60 TaxID=1940758 RepID=UPI000CEECC67|nr:hypothetical protein [Streptomyces sp. MH60]PPS89496.1 hypothetical protein BZZ08_01642 [Streptomyces sp. MH60]
MPLTSVPGQVAAGPIDGFLRDDTEDGTLGLPDYSLVPYTYAPLLGDTGSSPQWVIDQFRSDQFAAIKGSPDGYGVLRSTGADRGSVGLSVTLQESGTLAANPEGGRSPDSTWAPRDFVVPVRHSGSDAWTATDVRSYVAFTQAGNSVGMRLTTPAAEGPWDAERADSAAVPLPAAVNLWDGNPHSVAVAAFGQNVFCLVDGTVGIPFRAPRAYRRDPAGWIDTSVSSNLPGTGPYMGYDCRGSGNCLNSWTALQPASGDFFYYDMGALTIQTPPATTYTPTTTPSGETWVKTGTVTASKNGLAITASGSATFDVTWPYGVLCTRWTGASGAVVFRRVDANNYYQLSSAGIYKNVAGVLTRFHVFTTPPAVGDHIAIRNWADRIQVFINGVSVAYYSVDSHAGGKGIGFRSSSAGSTQWSYIAFQPMASDAVLPAA